VSASGQSPDPALVGWRPERLACTVLATLLSLVALMPALTVGLILDRVIHTRAMATLAAVLILVAAFRAPSRGVKAALILFAGVAAAAAWMRPDPLQPVAEVEEIVGLAFQVSPLIGGLALILLAVFAAVPAALTRPDARLKLAGAALSLCLAAWAVTPLFGAFPVPLVGVGMSPILGAWLGVGLLAATARARTP
jgi:hypothetical protein